MTLAVIVSQFPELHETFIVQELQALRAAGVPLRIYSLKRCRDRIVQPAARQLLDATTYVCWDQPWVWAAAGAQALRHPMRSLAALGWVARHHAWPLLTLLKALGVWWQSLALARAVRQGRVAHLHAHWATMPTTAAAVVSRLAGLPFSFTAHAWDVFVPNASLPEKLRLAERVITCTAYNREHLAQLCPQAQEKITLAYHGVDVKRFSAGAGGSARSAPLLLSVGRLVETKGFPTLLEAYRRLRERGVPFTGIIVGEGPMRRVLEAQLRAAGLSGLVELRGAMPQEALQELYAQARLFVLPCVTARNGDRDGIPNVILEAMAMGLPVVSTTVSGIPEAVEDGRTGCLVPPNDAAQLAGAMEQLLADPALARRLGQAGCERVKARFDAAEHVQQAVAQLQQLLRREAVPSTVMYVIWSLAVGGAERVVALLAQHLDRARYRPLVVCLNEEGALATPLRQAGVEVIALRKQGPADLHALWRLVSLMRQQRVRLVHTHLWGANLWGRLAARIAGIPVVATEHNTDTWKSWGYLLLDRWLAPCTSALIAVSQAVRDFYVAHGIGSGRWRVIPNGIETERFASAHPSVLYRELGWPEQTPVFLAIGRLVPAKRHDRFIDAIAQVVAARPGARGLIVGEGPLQPALAQRIAARGVQDRVVLAGVRHDVPALLAGARAVVFTSEREGLPMVTLEAMAAGVPVVSTPVGGVPEVIEDGRTGWLVPPDDEASLVERLTRLIDDPALARRAGAAAQTAVRGRWSLAAMVRAHDALYQRAVQPPVPVTFIIDHLGAGGAQRQLFELAGRLPQERFAVRVISLSDQPQAELDRFHAAGLEVACLAQSGTWDWGCFMRLVRVLRQQRPRIVHTWLFTADLYGRLAARLAGVPVVVSAVRSIDAGKPRHYVVADRWLGRLTNAVTVNAEAIRQVLQTREGLPGSKLHTIYNGVDLGVFNPAARNGSLRPQLRLGSSDLVVGIIGRLAPEKDHATFLQAAALVARQQPQVRFLIVGQGPLRGELERIARQLGLEPQVRFMDPPQEIAEVFAAIDLLALSSTYEGCSNVILEAMAMGKPVVATDVGGNPELVEVPRTGLLVPARQPEALAQALLQLLRDPPRARQMGEAARQRVLERFSVSRMVEQTAALYEHLLPVRRR